MKFKDLGINQEILTTIERLGLETPTDIQAESIPSIVKGKDIIGESATGSGKTLAFGCGIVEQVKHKEGLQSLVLTPTRELAEQVKDSLVQLSNRKLNIIVVYGGVSINTQIRELQRADVVVATPGRLLDHLSRKTINLSKVNLLVLDEADRMLDMGFIDDVEKIIKLCPEERQTLFFSATISSEIKRLTQRYMKDPVTVSVQNQVDPSKLSQMYYDIEKHEKLSLFVHLIDNEKSGLVMVFCNTRSNTDFVVANLRSNHVKAIAIHGGLSQNKRTSTLKTFNNGKVEVLVCTDVAARGLDIGGVSHVYNYDIPKDPKDYVHRIGRTARAGKEGKVINLLCNYDHDNFSRILRDYREFTIEKTDKPSFERVTPSKPERREHSSRSQRKSFSRGPRRQKVQYNNRRR